MVKAVSMVAFLLGEAPPTPWEVPSKVTTLVAMGAVPESQLVPVDQLLSPPAPTQ